MRGAGLDAAHFAGAGDVVVLFVPGWFYVKHGAKTGADFHEQRAVLTKIGVAHELVQADENGTVQR